LSNGLREFCIMCAFCCIIASSRLGGLHRVCSALGSSSVVRAPY
jgi:hypothetical protein